jgi:hypothetical protein
MWKARCGRSFGHVVSQTAVRMIDDGQHINNREVCDLYQAAEVLEYVCSNWQVLKIHK